MGRVAKAERSQITPMAVGAGHAETPGAPPPLDLFAAPAAEKITAKRRKVPPATAPLPAPPPAPVLAKPSPPAPGPARQPAPAAKASLLKRGYGLYTRSTEGDDSIIPFRSLEDLLSAVKPMLRATAGSPEPVWFSIQPVDLATIDVDG
jgi:hypothetical protein